MADKREQVLAKTHVRCYVSSYNIPRSPEWLVHRSLERIPKFCSGVYRDGFREQVKRLLCDVDLLVWG